MLVCEFFESIQGEGELAGVPSIFIRTAGCNLRCRWCDTPHSSWSPTGQEMSIEQIIQQVKLSRLRHCVLTGGEPMLAKQMHLLASRLHEEGMHITIETAGTLPPDGIVCDLASLSPKLSNSDPSQGQIADGWVERHARTRLRPDLLSDWIAHYSYQIKFVIASATDLIEVRSLLASLRTPIPACKVLLMPEGTCEESLRTHQQKLIEICKQEGFRYCDRLQIRLFGHTPGT